MMKIVISNGTMASGGAERVISILANKLVELGYEVELLLYHDAGIWYDLNPKVAITIDEKKIGKVSVWKHIYFRRKHLKKNAPDVVLSFLAPFNIIMILVMAGLNIPLIVADRNDPSKIPDNSFIRKVRDFLYRFATLIVVQTDTNKNYFSKAIRDKCEVIYNPIEIGTYLGVALQVEKKEKWIVSTGRLVPQKNQKIMIDAFALLSKKYSEYRLKIFGEGNYRTELEKYIEKKGLTDLVELPGNIKNIFDVIKKAQMFVLSSDYEGMPNALMEAMCLGLPVISTRVSGARDLIINRENGILVDSNDAVGLATQMEYIIEHPTDAKSMARKAIRVANKLNSERITEQWIQCIIKTIKGKDKT